MWLGLAAVAVAALLTATLWKNRRLGARLAAAQQILEVGNDAVLIADIVDGRLCLVNQAMVNLLDFDRQTLLKKRLPELHPADEVELSAQRIAEIWEAKGMVYSDLPFVRRDGERVPVEVSATVLSFLGRPAVLIYARDIRPRLEREQRIQQYSEQLERANLGLREAQAQLVHSAKMASLGRLVAGVAHEVNTPLGAITANADVVGRAAAQISSALGDQQLLAEKPRARIGRALAVLKEAESTIGVAAQRINSVVETLRSFSRLDEAEEKIVDLHQGLDSTVALVGSRASEHTQIVKAYGELPPVRCYPGQLNQLFANLLSNAIYAVDGKGGGTIRIETEPRGDDAVVRFVDNGVGIAADQLDRIFDPGYTTKGVGVGTGLGLSISYRIAQAHGGRIEVESQLGQGSTFSVVLPIGGLKT